MILNGKGLSQGVGRGLTQVIDTRAMIAAALAVPAANPPNVEIERLRAAIARATVELDRVQRHLSGRVNAAEAAIFASHTALLRDPQFSGRIERVIQAGYLSAEAGVAEVVTELHASFMAQPVALLHDKAADVLDIGRRVVHCLRSSLRENEVIADGGRVIVAASLTPSQLVRFARQGIVGVVVDSCGPKSHTAILARSLGIPLVAGVHDPCVQIADNVEAIVDASGNRVFVDLTAAERDQAPTVESPDVATEEDDFRPEPAVTPDGVTVRLMLNISDPSEAWQVQTLGTDGVGLFRTEFYYMTCAGWPTEEESYEVYREVGEAVGDAELHIRLVDFGADKCPPYSEIPINRNPSLGLRGIRLLLQRDDILQPQVRALARLGRERPLTVLVPMLDSLDTLNETTDRLCRIVGCAERSLLPFRLGAMIEVPAAALMIRDLLPHVDSISVGLNDLTQYLLAADRDDEYVERYHDAMQPAVLRLLADVVTAARDAGKPVTICGELAGDPRLTGLLLSLGLRRLSVSQSSYKAVLHAIRHISVRGVRELGEMISQMTTAAAVRDWVRRNLTPPTGRDLQRG